MNRIKNTLFLLLTGMLCLSAVQKRYGIVVTKPLNGYFTATGRPAFSCSTFMTGEYQEKLRLSLEDSVGFKPWLVRLYNQIDYSLFSIAHAEKMVVGKEGYLFADSYIKGFTGVDFAGKYYIDRKTEQLKFLQEYLQKEKGITLLVIFAPGKGFYYPEYIPGRFLRKHHPVTNYGYYLQRCNELGINHIDFNRWLVSMKDTAKYMLYPKTGIHWSSYGAYRCADSLHQWLAVRLQRNIPRMVTDSLILVDHARDDDNDQERTMNLIREISHPPMAYPAFRYVYDSVKPKPRALFIGDSFYWYWYYNKIIENTFSNTDFWYYNNEVYPDQFSSPKNVGQIDFTEGIFSQDVVILLQTNGGYGDLGYGWVDVAYDHLYPGATRIKEFRHTMENNPEWMRAIEEKARSRNISVDHMMRLDAIHLTNQELKNHPENRKSLPSH